MHPAETPPRTSRSRPPLAAGDTATPKQSWSWHTVSVRKPYRLDLTATVLRRSATNPVDVLTRDGEYIRWFGGEAHPEVVRVRQTGPDSLAVAIEAPRGEHRRLLALAKRSLGADADVDVFREAAARISWLSDLAERVRGVRPPRYPSLWEASLNAVIFQQVSLEAASAIMNRLIELGPTLEREGTTLRQPPDIGLFDGRHEAQLRAAGLSTSKLATLQRIAGALASGALSEAQVEELPSGDAALLLQRIKGIGPWTAAVILLRGFGRLDVFPPNDSGVARNLALLAGTTPVEIGQVLAALRPHQGMLYYHLLLARLAARRAHPTTRGGSAPTLSRSGRAAGRG